MRGRQVRILLLCQVRVIHRPPLWISPPPKSFSITAGAHSSDRSTKSYPAVLQHLLDPAEFVVTNLGSSGATLQATKSAYNKRSTYKTLVAGSWDIVVIMLGERRGLSNVSLLPIPLVEYDRHRQARTTRGIWARGSCNSGKMTVGRHRTLTSTAARLLEPTPS